MKDVKFSTLKGRILKSIYKLDDDELIFETNTGEFFLMWHEQDCCERVYIEDIVGNLNDLIGSHILVSDEASNSDDPPAFESAESYTWTYYKLATVKGYVDIRWFGSSNGYYSESVRLSKLSKSDINLYCGGSITGKTVVGRKIIVYGNA